MCALGSQLVCRPLNRSPTEIQWRISDFLAGRHFELDLIQTQMAQ
jgi:hypothetical protein